jgi:hypothetical protein
LTELTTLRDQLKAGLSATAHETANAEGPSVSELADRIKALKAAHTIESAPQRVRQNQATAEEPVTARIRRRSKTADRSEVTQPDVAEPGEGWNDSSVNPPQSFLDRINWERRQTENPERTL